MTAPAWQLARRLGVPTLGAVVATMAAPQAGFSALEVALISGLVLLVLKRQEDFSRHLTHITGVLGGRQTVDERIAGAMSDVQERVDRAASRIAARTVETMGRVEDRLSAALEDHETRIRLLENNHP